MGTYQPCVFVGQPRGQWGASLGREPGLDSCPGVCLVRAVPSPGPCSPLHAPPAQHLVCSRRGLIQLCPWSSAPCRRSFASSQSLNPAEEGGHELGALTCTQILLSLSLKRQSSPKSRLLTPQGLCKWTQEGFSLLLLSTGMWGAPATPLRPICSAAQSAAHILGGICGSIPCFSHSSNAFGAEILLLLLAQLSSVGSTRVVHTLGPGPLSPPSAGQGENISFRLPIPIPATCGSHSPAHTP